MLNCREKIATHSIKFFAHLQMLNIVNVAMKEEYKFEKWNNDWGGGKKKWE